MYVYSHLTYNTSNTKIKNCYNYCTSIESYYYANDTDSSYKLSKAGRITAINIGNHISNCYSIETTLLNRVVPIEEIGLNLLNGANLATDEPEDDTSEYGTLTETGSCGDNAFYDFYEETGTLVIRGAGEMSNCKFSSLKWYNNIICVVINPGITSIADYAFANCINLKNVEISNSVIYIGYSAFENCDSITSIVIPDSVKTMGNRAFVDCSFLKSIKLSNNLSSIEYETFSGCYTLENLQIPDSVGKIGTKAFYGCSGLINITIGNGVTDIGPDAFYWCSNLKDLIIGENVTSIGKCAFYGCSNLLSIFVPNSVTTIGQSAFAECSNLTNVVIGNGLSYIDWYVFENCTNLKKIEISKSVTEIHNSAFSNCTNLAEVYYEGTEEEWEKIVFYGSLGVNTCFSNATIHYNS